MSNNVLPDPLPVEDSATQASTASAATVLGNVNDAAVTSNTTGTISAKLRGLTALIGSAWDAAANLLKARMYVGDLAVSGTNPVPVSGTLNTVGATLNIVTALSETDYNIGGAAYSGTSAISGPYKLNSIKFKFSTASAKTITVTDATTGTIVSQPVSTTATDYVIPLNGIGFPDGHQFTVAVTQTPGPCLMTFSADIENGQLPMGGNPVLGSPELGTYIGDVGSLATNARDSLNEQTTPLIANDTFTGSFRRIDQQGSIQILYASLTPITSVKIIWSEDGVTPMAGLLGTSTLTQRVITGYNVVYQVYSGDLIAPYYRLEVVNGASDQTAFPGFISITWLNREPYNGVFDFTDAEPSNLTKALVVKQFHQKTVKLTDTPLGIGGTFTTVGLTAGGFTANAQGYFAGTNWADVDFHVWGAPFNAHGTLYFAFSHDGVTDHIGPVPVQINDLTQALPIPLRNFAYWRAYYVNNSVAQTSFGLFIVQRASVASDLTRTLTQVIGPSEPVKVTRSMVEPSPVGERGFLGADRDVFGAGIVASRIARITLNPTRPLANNRVTVTETGGGTVTQEPTYAEFRLNSGTGTTSVARMVSIITNPYMPGNEDYVMVPVRFTTGIANCAQRVGMFTDAEGFWLGFDGTTMGFAIRTGSLDTFTPLTAANGDPLDGSGNSRFARGGILEPLNPEMKNVWRGRIGLLGSSLQFFDLQSPDGLWMRVNSNRFPNLQQKASLLNWDLPFRAEVVKSGAATTPIIVGIGSVNAGFVGNPYGLEPSTVFGRENVHVGVAGITASGIQYTPPTGRTLVIKSVQMTATNTSTGGPALIRLRDGSGGTLLYSIRVEESSGTIDKVQGADQTFPEGLRVATNLYAEVVSGTVNVDLMADGYTEAM